MNLQAMHELILGEDGMQKAGVKLILLMMILALVSACAPSAAPATENLTQPETDTQVEGQSESITEPISIKVGIQYYLSYAPLFIAQEEGYFAEQGLDVELINFGSSANSVPGLLAKEYDIAGLTFSVSVMNAIAQGGNIKYVADKGFLDPENCVTDAFVASNAISDVGIATDSSLIIGKRAAITPGGTIEYAFDVLLEDIGFTQDDLEMVVIKDTATRIEGLNNGSVDVTNLSEPWVTKMGEMQAGQVWVPYADVIPNLSLGLIGFGPGILEDKPEAGVPFMIAYLRGVEQFNQGKTDRNVEIIAKYTEQSPEDITSSCWTSFRSDNVMDTQGMLAFQKWALEKGYLDAELSLDAFWMSEFLDQAVVKLEN